LSERRWCGSVCRGFGVEAISDELAVVFDGIKMDMKTRIGGEVLEMLSDADEGFPMTQLLGEDQINRSLSGSLSQSITERFRELNSTDVQVDVGKIDVTS
jgi:hypothetical protein